MKLQASNEDMGVDLLNVYLLINEVVEFPSVFISNQFCEFSKEND
jgi:hypothetical protein